MALLQTRALRLCWRSSLHSRASDRNNSLQRTLSSLAATPVNTKAQFSGDTLNKTVSSNFCRRLHRSCIAQAQPSKKGPDKTVKGGKGSLVKCFVERIVEDATAGDLKCPECGTEFARPAMIRGKPANKIIGGVHIHWLGHLLSQHITMFDSHVKMDDGYMEQFPTGAIDHIGLPESTLPKEVIQILPSDYYAQLELAHHISCYAFSSKAKTMEAENQQLKHALTQKTSQVKTLESRLTSTQLDLQESQEKARTSEEQAHRLGNEKAALINTVRKLNRDVAKLDNFKRNLLNSLQADEEVRMIDEAESTLSSIDNASDRLVQSVLKQAHQSGTFSSAGLHSTGSMYTSYPLSPSRSTSAQMAPGGGGINAHRTTSYSSAAPTSAPASPTRIDGKEFFRQARQRLSNDSFSLFLQAIKELNSGKKTREDTLHTANDIFGATNGDLYSSFESLLSRHLPPM
ncbi:hypothetical protein WJX82_011580 [Trebouxia sp. C0006]